MHIYAVDNTIAEKARDIRRSSNVRSEDAVHLATAIHMKCDVLLTNDGDTDASKRKKLIPLDGKHGIHICTPKVYMAGKFPLFSSASNDQ